MHRKSFFKNMLKEWKNYKHHDDISIVLFPLGAQLKTVQLSGAITHKLVENLVRMLLKLF
jgi:hypothetical protein